MRFAAYGLAGLVVAYGVFLLVIGQPWTLYAESPTGGVDLGREFRPVITGLIPVVGGAAVLLGLALRASSLSWLGWLVVAGFAGMFVFGVGGALVPVAAILFFLLVIEHGRLRA